jgi:nitrate/TMAO reductase-like tetraheme cytochrome c subunit
VTLPAGTPRVKSKRRWPKLTVDLGRPRHRAYLVLALIGLFVLGSVIVFAGVAGYDYTESVPFCGTVCHSMYPQLVRYEASPHSNVACTQCHVGSGAEAFVQSKIAGTRQLVGTILDNYHRPIKSPVQNLRPARETCETCHTPTSFKDNIVKNIMHYDNDRANTPILTSLILKMGGFQESTGHSQGIHWHIQSKIYYIAADYQRQKMMWVGVEQPDGSLKEYFSRDLVGMGQTDFVEQARKEGKVREMDCIDCHNRAAHYIPYPEESVDQAITDGLISPDLPYVHSKAVDLLSQTYTTSSEAYAAIDKLAEEYKLTPVGAASPEKVQQLKATLTRIYDSTVFPFMKLDWQTNPNNAKHTPTEGCFRCHDGNHILADSVGSPSGEQVISVKCNLCHTVPIIGKGDEMVVEAPVIVGAPPASHNDFRWTIEHRNVTDAEKQACYQCHGQGFCNNGACHNLSHPPDMLYTHPEIYKQTGGQVCYNCHQNITCTRCHAGGVVSNP